jgi:autotransporter-associated beta strand protein
MRFNSRRSLGIRLEIYAASCCDRLMKRLFPVICVFSCLLVAHSFAGSAAWNLNPTSGDWNTAANWTPATVPNSSTDIATFDVSNTTAVSLSASVTLSGMVFDAGASAYTITAPNATTLTFDGSGITNNSGVTQNVVLGAGSSSAIINFNNGATPGPMTHFDLQGTSLNAKSGGAVQFFDFSNAGSATFDLEGSPPRGFPTGVSFLDISSAGSGTFILHAGTAAGGQPGVLGFNGNAFAGTATFICEGPAFAHSVGASVNFLEDSSAFGSTITVNGSQVAGNLFGATVWFTGDSDADQATLIANGGVDAGGLIRFSANASGGASRIMVFGNGSLDISLETLSSVTIGSLEGDGLVLLGSKTLAVGSSSTNATFSGTLQDGGEGGGIGGSLTKVGSGTLMLRGASTYTGLTTVSDGTLVIGNLTGSATGTGPVQVNAGRIGGRGTIAGAVTIGTGMGSGAILKPEVASNKKVTLTIQNPLTFKTDATYSYGINSSSGAADSVVANGVTIDGGRLVFLDKGSATLPRGTFFTAINNTGTTSISGRFSNLPDGATFTVGSNTYQADYEGGDGNDLTLTVVAP